MAHRLQVAYSKISYLNIYQSMFWNVSSLFNVGDRAGIVALSVTWPLVLKLMLYAFTFLKCWVILVSFGPNKKFISYFLKGIFFK